MAKRVDASLLQAGKDYAKVIKVIRSQKSGAYTFKEEIIPTDQVKTYFEQK